MGFFSQFETKNVQAGIFGRFSPEEKERKQKEIEARNRVERYNRYTLSEKDSSASDTKIPTRNRPDYSDFMPDRTNEYKPATTKPAQASKITFATDNTINQGRRYFDYQDRYLLPKFEQVARQEQERMDQERILEPKATVLDKTVAGVKAGVAGAARGLTGFSKIVFNVIMSSEDTKDYIPGTLQYSKDKPAEKVPTFFGKITPDKTKDAVNSFFDKTDKYLSGKMLKNKELYEKDSSKLGGYFYGSISAFTMMLPTIATSFATGGVSVASMLPFMTQAAGSYYLDAKEKNMTEDESVKYGMAAGILEGLTEMIPFGYGFKLLKGGAKAVATQGVMQAVKKYSGNALKAVITNILEETSINPALKGLETGIAGTDFPMLGEGGYFDPQEAVDSAIGGGMLSLLYSALGLPMFTINTATQQSINKSFEKAKDVAAEYLKTKEGQDKYKDIMATAEERKDPTLDDILNMRSDGNIPKRKPYSEMTTQEILAQKQQRDKGAEWLESGTRRKKEQAIEATAKPTVQAPNKVEPITKEPVKVEAEKPAVEPIVKKPAVESKPSTEKQEPSNKKTVVLQITKDIDNKKPNKAVGRRLIDRLNAVDVETTDVEAALDEYENINLEDYEGDKDDYRADRQNSWANFVEAIKAIGDDVSDQKTDFAREKVSGGKPSGEGFKNVVKSVMGDKIDSNTLDPFVDLLTEEQQTKLFQTGITVEKNDITKLTAADYKNIKDEWGITKDQILKSPDRYSVVGYSTKEGGLKIFIDPNKATTETLIHEIEHLLGMRDTKPTAGKATDKAGYYIYKQAKALNKNVPDFIEQMFAEKKETKAEKPATKTTAKKEVAILTEEEFKAMFAKEKKKEKLTNTKAREAVIDKHIEDGYVMADVQNVAGQEALVSRKEGGTDGTYYFFTKPAEIAYVQKKVNAAIDKGTAGKAPRITKELIAKVIGEADGLTASEKKFFIEENKDLEKPLLKKFQKIIAEAEKKKLNKSSIAELKKIMIEHQEKRQREAAIKQAVKDKIEDHYARIKTNALIRKLERAEQNEFIELVRTADKIKDELPPQFRDAIIAIIDNIDSTAKSIKTETLANLTAIDDYYKYLQDMAIRDDRLFYMPEYIKEMVGRLYKTKISEMDIQDIIDMKRLLANIVFTGKWEIAEKKAIDKAVNSYVKKQYIITTRTWLENIKKWGKNVRTLITEDMSGKPTPMKHSSFIDLVWKKGSLDLDSLLLKITNGDEANVLYDAVYNRLNKAVAEYYGYTMADQDTFIKLLGDIDTSEWYEFKEHALPSGRKYQFRELDWINFYLHSKAGGNNMEALMHSYRRELTKRGGERTKDLNAIKGLTEEDIDYGVKQLSKDGKKYAEFLWKMFNDDYYDAGDYGMVPTWKKRWNKGSMEMYGFEIATEKNHVRSVMDHTFKADTSETVGKLGNFEVLATHQSYSELIAKRKGIKSVGLVGEDPLLLYQRIMHDSSAFASYAKPAHDVKAILTAPDMQEFIARTFGNDYNEIIAKHIAVMDGNMQKLDTIEKWFLKAQSKVMKAILTNPWIWVNQLASIPYALSEIEPKHLAGAAKIRLTNEVRLAMKKYMPTLWMRRLGLSFLEIADLTMLEQKGKAGMVETAKRGVTGFGPQMVTKFDSFAIDFILRLSMAKVNAQGKHTYGTEEYWKAVYEVAKVAMERTQPNFTWLHRSLIHTKGPVLSRALLPFMTVLLKTRSMMSRAHTYRMASSYNKTLYNEAIKNNDPDAGKYLYAARKNANKTIMIMLSLLLGSLSVALRNFIRDKVYRRDTDVGEFIIDTLGGFASALPGLRDVIGIKDGFDPLTMPLIKEGAYVLTSLWNAGNGIIELMKMEEEYAKKYGANSKEYQRARENKIRTTMRNFKSALVSTGTLFAIPLKQLESSFGDPLLRLFGEDVLFKYKSLWYTDTYLKGLYHGYFFEAVKAGNTDKAKEFSAIIKEMGTNVSAIRSSGKDRGLEQELIDKAASLHSEYSY